jgi:hypothetical protein
VRLAAVAQAIALASLGALVLVPACSLGEGQGQIHGTLNVPNCWSGRFDLAPDFYAGVPYRDTLELRIQRGGDFETFSDGIVVMIDDVHAIRPDRGPGKLGQALDVSLPPEVTPPGVPVKPVANPASVHVALYLQRSCRTQNVALFAVDQALLNDDGSCSALADGGQPPDPCTAANMTPQGDAGSSAGPVGHSTITFNHLFNGVPEETDAAKRLNDGSFDIYLVDPREICPGGLGPPPRCRGHLTGSFHFYFERGRPAQPFP